MDQTRLTTGPDLTGDLLAFADKKELSLRLAGLDKDGRAAGRLWMLAHDVQPGHIMVVPGIEHRSSISIGVVKEGYPFEPVLPSTFAMAWLSNGSRQTWIPRCSSRTSRLNSDLRDTIPSASRHP